MSIWTQILGLGAQAMIPGVGGLIGQGFRMLEDAVDEGKDKGGNKGGDVGNQGGDAGRDQYNIIFQAAQNGNVEAGIEAVRRKYPNVDLNVVFNAIEADLYRFDKGARGTPEWLKLVNANHKLAVRINRKPWGVTDTERALLSNMQQGGAQMTNQGAAPSSLNQDPSRYWPPYNPFTPTPTPNPAPTPPSKTEDPFTPDTHPMGFEAPDPDPLGDLPTSGTTPPTTPPETPPILPFQTTPHIPGMELKPADLPGYSPIPAALGGLMGALTSLGRDPKFYRPKVMDQWRTDFRDKFKDIAQDAQVDPYQGDFFLNANRAAQTATNLMLKEDANIRSKQSMVTGALFGGGTQRALASMAPGFYANQGNLLSRGYQIQHEAANMENQYAMANTDADQQHFQWEVNTGTHQDYQVGANKARQVLGSTLAGAAAFDDIYSNIWKRGIERDLYAKSLGTWQPKESPEDMNAGQRMWFEKFQDPTTGATRFGTQAGPPTESQAENTSIFDLDRISTVRQERGLRPVNWNLPKPAMPTSDVQPWYQGGTGAGPMTQQESLQTTGWDMTPAQKYQRYRKLRGLAF